MGDDVFRDAIREVLVLRVRAQVEERQNRDGRRPWAGRGGERLGESEGRCPPVGRDLGECLRQCLLDAHRHRGPQPSHCRHGIDQPLGDQHLSGCSRIRRFAGEHFVQHAAEAVHVGASVQGSLTHRLLRTHVRRRPHGEPRQRESLTRCGAHG